MIRSAKIGALSALAAFALLAQPAFSAPAKPRVGGYVKDSDASYLATPLLQRTRAFLPEKVDLTERMPPPGNQGNLSSCTAWAVTYAARSYYAAGQQNRDRLDARSALSPAYVFNRLSRGNCSHPTSINDVLTVLRDDGSVPIGDFPYIDGECARQPTGAEQKNAAGNRVRTWQRLESQELDAIKGQLANGHPVIVPLNLPHSFDRFAGSAVYDDDRKDRDFPHAMVIVGYDDKRQAFRFMNSWDTDWGDGGFIWISYRAYQTLQMDRAYVIDLPPPPPRAKLLASLALPAPQAELQPAAPEAVSPPVTQPNPIPETRPAPPPPAVIAPEPARPSPPVSVAPPAPSPTPSIAPTAPAKTTKSTNPPAAKLKPEPPPAPPKSVGPLILPAPAMAPVNPAPKPAPLTERIEHHLADLRCARVHSDNRSGRVRLTGFAGDAKEVATLRNALLAEPGVTGLDDQIAIKPWPQCEVLLNFAGALSANHGLQARLQGASRSEGFAEGDRLQIEIEAPDFPAYLYVTYLQQGGEVLHLHWPSPSRPRPVAPGTRVALGADGRYLVSPPFGTEAVIIVASASPLFIDEMPQIRDDRDYLSAFRRAFALRPADNSGARQVQAVMLPLTTGPR